MPIPNSIHARVEAAKLSDYLLNLFHPVGGAKARWFVSYAFSPDEPELLGSALVAIAELSDDFESVETEYGIKYTVYGTLKCPNGEAPKVKTIWMSSPEEYYPLLVTAYPDKTS